MSEPLLAADGIRKQYVTRNGVLHILSGADLHVAPGETLAIVGVSGAGKSTLLHILGGLDRPDAGCVRLAGEDLYRVSRRRRTQMRARRIGFVFQSYHLLPEMDVLENVMLPSMAMQAAVRRSRVIRERAAALLEQVGLEERASHTPLELSGGEQQRVALARALMNEPELVLADEPTGNLDEGTGHQVMQLLFSLTRERRHSLVLVTHSEETAAFCDRRLRLTGGRLEPS